MKKILTFIIIIAMTLSMRVPAFAVAPATVTVVSPTAAVNPGSTVDVAVTIADNPGMDVMKLKFSYDTAALTLKDIELGNVMTDPFTKNLDKAVAILEAAGTTNATGNGTLVTLKFEVKSTATAGNYTIGFLVADAVNRDEERVALTTQAGTVSVGISADIILDKDGNRVFYGDILTDGEINGKDAVLLSQYLAGWTSAKLEDASLKAADVYRDNVVDGKDAVLLSQYLAGWSSATEIFNRLNK